MAKSMSRSTRDEYLEKMRCRYRRYTGKPAKSRLLFETWHVEPSNNGNTCTVNHITSAAVGANMN